MAILICAIIKIMNESQRIKFQISQGSVIRTLLTLSAFALLFILRDIILVLLVSVVIASSIEPITRVLISRKIPRLPSVICIYLVAGTLFVLSFYYILLPLLNESASFMINLPSYFSGADIWNPLNNSLGNETSTFFQGISKNFSLTQAVSEFREVISGTSDSFFVVASYIFGGVLSFILVIVLSFYLAVQEDGVGDFLKIITPIQHEKYIIDLWKRVETKIGRWFQGQIILATIVGLLVYLGLMIFGVEHALFFASLAMILEIIPVFGPIIAGIPALSSAYFQGGSTLAVIVFCLYTIIQQFESSFIYPVVVRKIVGVPPIMVILSLIIGFKLFGFLGIIISVPVAAVLMELLLDWERRKI